MEIDTLFFNRNHKDIIQYHKDISSPYIALYI